MARLKPSLLAICLTLIAGCADDEDTPGSGTEDRRIIDPVETIGPYSPAVEVDGFLFVSGQIGIDLETGNLVDTGIAAETQRALENLNVVLRAAGFDSSHVVSTTVYLRNIEDYPLMNQIYGGYFEEGNYPARSTVAVNALPRGASVEIAAVAFRTNQ